MPTIDSCFRTTLEMLIREKLQSQSQIKNISRKQRSPHSHFHKCRAIQTGASAIIGPQSACMGEGEKEGEGWREM